MFYNRFQEHRELIIRGGCHKKQVEIYKGLIAPILKHLDSETWHTNARNLIRLAGSNPVTLSVLESLSHRREYEDERLKVLVGGIEFENPVMVGAGWDKEGVAVKGLSALGFLELKSDQFLSIHKRVTLNLDNFWLAQELFLIVLDLTVLEWKLLREI